MARQKKQVHSKKIKLGRYPYTYVRTAVMRSLLFRKEDYHKLLKMGFNEIAKFLQESHYRSEINQLAAEHSGADLLELALNKSLSASFKKLMRVSSYELGLLVREYARRKDIDDIKTILRGKLTNADEKDILKSLTAAGALSHDFLASLLKKASVDEILKDSRLFDFHIPKIALADLREKNSLAGIENALDKSYYSDLIEFSGLLPKEGALFRSFLLKEIEVLNILTLLRLKKSSLDGNNAKEFIILSGDRQKDLKMMAMANAKGLEELSGSLEKTEYKSIILKGIEELKKGGSLVGVEAQLYKGLLRQSTLFMHQHPLSIDIILGYMLAKDIEVRNMRIIIKGKQLGLSEEFIESQLVF